MQFADHFLGLASALKMAPQGPAKDAQHLPTAAQRIFPQLVRIAANEITDPRGQTAKTTDLHHQPHEWICGNRDQENIGANRFFSCVEESSRLRTVLC
ncbi:MAG: hypothetical protein WA183_19930 [Chthoniobacterales bacterium]